MEALDSWGAKSGHAAIAVKAKNVVHAVKPAMACPRQPLNYLGSYAIRLFPG